MGTNELKRARLAQLPRLTTEELIAQYDRADAKRGARHNPETGVKTALQRRVDKIVDLLFDRAEAGDAVALAWFETADR